MGSKTRDLRVIYTISFLDLFAIGLLFPLFGNHLRDLGASHFTVGLIHSLYSGLQILSGPLIGRLSDIYDRKLVFIISLFLCTLSYTGLGLTTSLVTITSLRVMMGVTKHTQTLCKALITDLVPKNERSSAFSQSAAYSQLGFIIGPILGGHLSEFSNGFAYVCFLTGTLFLLNIILARSLTPLKAVTETVEQVAPLSDLKWRDLWGTFFLRFIFGLSHTMYLTQQAVYLREYYELSQLHIGYVISYFSTTGTVSAFILPFITKVFYKQDRSCYVRMLHFFALMTFSTIALFLAPNIQMFLLCLIPFSFSCTILRIVSMELMLKEASNGYMGSLSGTSNSIMSIARFLTPVTTGVLTDSIGGHFALLVTVIPPFIGTILTYHFKNKIMTKRKVQ